MYLTNLNQSLPTKCCACREVYFASTTHTSGELHHFANSSCQNQRRAWFQYEKALFPITFLALSVKFPDFSRFSRFSLTKILFPDFSRISRFSRLWTTMVAHLQILTIGKSCESRIFDIFSGKGHNLAKKLKLRPLQHFLILICCNYTKNQQVRKIIEA